MSTECSKRGEIINKLKKKVRQVGLRRTASRRTFNEILNSANGIYVQKNNPITCTYSFFFLVDLCTVIQFFACSGRYCVSADVLCNYLGTCEHIINPLNAELNPICHLLALLGGATIVVVSRLRVNHMVMFEVSKAVLLKTQIFWDLTFFRIFSIGIMIFKR
jgi:hypothetical protein